jgi:hypothetical protein
MIARVIVRLMLAGIGLSLLSTPARAQTTADGVAALVRGDTARAAEILQPIVEDRHHVDGDAAFFLGTLYETGSGVPVDTLRACALYQMAGSAGGVFAQAAMTLLRGPLLSHDSAWRQDCTSMANLGIGNRFEPATFALDPDQSVDWSIGGVTVTYQQRAKWFPLPMGTRGSIFLPLKQTDLSAPAAGATPLHFVQLALVEPSSDSWTLTWTLYEVDRGELHFAAREAVTRFNGPDPPDVARFDLSSVVDLHVNDSGLPEYTVHGPRGPKIVVIRLNK